MENPASLQKKEGIPSKELPTEKTLPPIDDDDLKDFTL